LLGIELPPINKVLFAGVGFVAPPMVEGLIADFLPAEFSATLQGSTIGKYALRIAAVLAVSFGVKKFIGKSEGDMALIGGGVYVASTAAMEFLPGVFGSHAPALPAATVKGYVAVPRTQLNGYVASNQRVNDGLGMPSMAFANLESSGASGGTAVRFKRT
jgi:hypothetical protein